LSDSTFPARLRQLREAAGLTVMQAACAAGINRVSWHKLEAGQYDPSLATARRLARALGVGLGAFDDPPPPAEKSRKKSV
jgi:DNA-binding XRE family transcriptional regulator